MSQVVRAGGALGAVAAFLLAMTRGGLTAWATGTLGMGSLVLVAAILFLPSETPARRLCRLIQAWQSPVVEPERPSADDRP
ncbi:hypothetical protein ACFVXW_16685 [Streptomyces sp. NPDC058251]|uniref:hypothetical protein n=1 Tax=Streptomyces sp. NPDC058251 TaxID=3346404 RepID=UPI0036EAC084